MHIDEINARLYSLKVLTNSRIGRLSDPHPTDKWSWRRWKRHYNQMRKLMHRRNRVKS